MPLVDLEVVKQIVIKAHSTVSLTLAGHSFGSFQFCCTEYSSTHSFDNVILVHLSKFGGFFIHSELEKLDY